MYMVQIQEVSPDAADSGPIFDDEPLQKVSNVDHYNVFAMESTHSEQSKSVHDTYPIEQDAQNVIIDSLDMNYDREEIDQNDDDNDLAKERELLASLIEKLKCEIDESKTRNKILETSNKALIKKLKGEIEDFKNKNKSLESSNNFFKEANNKLSETNNLLYADYKKSEAELARRNSTDFADALVHMPKFAPMFKKLLNNKDKLIELTKMPLNENCSAVVLKKLPEKLGDPDEPPEVELKELPPHLEYALLGDNGKRPVIIAKDLSSNEKTALINVLKTRKKAIAWKLTDIKGIDHEFCSHKILLEEDYSPKVQSQRRPFKLMCDASDYAVGAVLGQRIEKHFRPIHYASKTMNQAKANYITTEKEMVAVVYAFEKFRSYLIMNKSIVYTDHSALKYLFAKKGAKARLLR
nr:reverse transcriptase domain-containing protein [Tanacetum cinerariifolium]